MATTPVDRVMVDTNVLVNATVSTAPFHRRARTALAMLQQQAAELWVSRQVLREYLAVLSRPQAFSQPLRWSALAADIERFGQQFRIGEEGPDVTARLLALGNEVAFGGRQVHDANLVATMLVNAIPCLLTLNTADFDRFRHLIEVNEPT